LGTPLPSLFHQGATKAKLAVSKEFLKLISFLTIGFPHN
tara:strand:- start:1490 stop:1606 length:117 start_codon:yes stop_codon:yes gene_type:complete